MQILTPGGPCGTSKATVANWDLQDLCSLAPKAFVMALVLIASLVGWYPPSLQVSLDSPCFCLFKTSGFFTTPWLYTHSFPYCSPKSTMPDLTGPPKPQWKPFQHQISYVLHVPKTRSTWTMPMSATSLSSSQAFLSLSCRVQMPGSLSAWNLIVRNRFSMPSPF